MQIERRPLSELAPAPYNPRADLKPGDKEYEKLKKSILEFGIVEPIILNVKTGTVVGGHQRLKVLMELGEEETDVVIVDLPEDREKALNIALNKISGDWDMPKLKDILEELDATDIDIELTGFDEKELDAIMAEFGEQAEIKEDEVPEPPEEPITKRGDIWQLGRHRLMCGDSTIITDVERLMDGALADMVFTDPPYNVAYTGKTKDALTIQNDQMGGGQYYEFLTTAFSNMLLNIKEGGPAYIFHADTEGLNVRRAFVDAGWELKQVLIWAKQQFVMGRQDYHWKHEPCLYGWRPGAAHCWYGRRDKTTVLEFDRPSRSSEHPTMKPIALCAFGIENSTRVNEAVLDLFLGSGSVLIACEQTRRVCYGMELDPRYCDVVIKRWENLTGEVAVRITENEPTKGEPASVA